MDQNAPFSGSFTVVTAAAVVRTIADAIRDLTAKMKGARSPENYSGGGDYRYRAGAELSALMTAVRVLVASPAMAEWLKLWRQDSALGGRVLGGLLSSLKRLQLADRYFVSLSQGSLKRADHQPAETTLGAIAQFADWTILFLQVIVLPALHQVEQRELSGTGSTDLAVRELRALVAAVEPAVASPMVIAWIKTWKVDATLGGQLLGNLLEAATALVVAEGRGVPPAGNGLLAVALCAECAVDFLRLIVVPAVQQSALRDQACTSVISGRAWIDGDGNIVRGRRRAA